MTKPVHIIAEAGTTHEGNIQTAVELVAFAKEAGADSVKFQIIDSPELYLTEIRDDDNRLIDNPVVAIRDKQGLSNEEWHQLAKHAASSGIAFSASIFDKKSLSFLLDLAPPYLKIASTDTTNDALIEAACATGKPLLLSTGMSDLGEIDHAVETLSRAGAKDVVLLHCVSVYPCPTNIANVGFVSVLKNCFGLPVGFSDHTESSTAAIAAVALGASWIEKHFTYDRTAQGFDHAYAMEPDMLKGFIADIRQAEAALRVQQPKVGELEVGVKERARRSLWVARDLSAGHILTRDDVLVVRPAGPLSPVDLPRILGRKLIRPLAKSMIIRLEDLQ